MRVLYINNFRNFKNTFIELKDINFFVGENSTGKTSILSLLSLLSSIWFSYEPSFNLDNVNFGTFEEIASKSSEGENFFEIAFLKEEKNKKYENRYSLAYYKFINFEGMPKLSNFRYIESCYNVEVVLNKQIKFRYKKIDIFNKDEQDVLLFFKNWIKTNNLRSTSYIHLDNLSEKADLREIQFEIFEYLDIKDISLVKPFLRPCCWTAPIRAKTRRTYDEYNQKFSPDGEHTPYLIRNILVDKTKQSLIDSINSFGIKSNLFERIEIKKYSNSKISPFEINIIIDGKERAILNVGYGVSQILPLITELLFRSNNTWFFLQQPEVHLHPKAQAAFGEFIFDVYKSTNKRFLIETHSDFVLDRFRFCQWKNPIENFNAQVLFFERNNAENKVHQIEIEDTGKYSEKQPESFRDFFINESINLLEV